MALNRAGTQASSQPIFITITRPMPTLRITDLAPVGATPPPAPIPGELHTVINPREAQRVTAAADGDTSEILRVEFYADAQKIGDAPGNAAGGRYTITWASPPVRHGTLLAVARLRGGRYIVSPSVQLTGQQRFAVNLAAPTPWLGFISPAPFTLVARPQDMDYPIAKVEFFANDQKIGEADKEPYSCLWENVAPGATRRSRRH